MARVKIRRAAASGGATAFVRFAVPGETVAERVFTAVPDDRERTITLPYPGSTISTRIHLERLVTAGT